ncbi:electron transfer flavoprotein subunit beta/FixA family protein [bacterium]|nr:electron transfer flavoprotein subunit beta/FixA family protein [bacterium]
MNIVVCVKHVPDTASRIRIGANGTSIDTSDISFVLNPYDEIAVEESLKLKEAQGGNVTVLTLGGENASSSLRTALAMGADEAIHIKAENWQGDSYATAKNIANEIQKLPFDLILFGKQAVDDDNLAVPQMVAEFLGIPSVTVVVSLEINGNTGKAEREIEGGKEVVEFSLPVAIAAQKGLNEPRYPSMKGIMTAKRKTITTIEATQFEAKAKIVKMEIPASRSTGKILGGVSELIGSLKNEAKVI